MLCYCGGDCEAACGGPDLVVSFSQVRWNVLFAAVLLVRCCLPFLGSLSTQGRCGRFWRLLESDCASGHCVGLWFCCLRRVELFWSVATALMFQWLVFLCLCVEWLFMLMSQSN